MVPRPVDPLLSSPVPASSAAFCKSNDPIWPNQMDYLGDSHQFEAETSGVTPDLPYPGGSDYHDSMELPDELPPPVPDVLSASPPSPVCFQLFL